MPNNADACKESFNRLRQKFATAANAQDLLRKLDFEENIMAQHRDKILFNATVIRILEENVPNVEPHVILAATLMTLPRGMVNEQRFLDKYDRETRDLYLAARKTDPVTGALQSPEIAQIALALAIAGAEALNESRKTNYLPYAQIAGTAQHLNRLKSAIRINGTFGAPALEQLLITTADALDTSVRDFFKKTPPKSPPHP